MSPEKTSPRELQIERFLTAIREHGNEQLVEDFLAAFAEIAQPVRPEKLPETPNIVGETYVLRGFWVPVESSQVGVEKFRP
jgi:hypothetical protein